jgi:molybdenum cofactor cytidylyltransferase
MIWAVVLAAGESRRMGRQKLLLDFGANTVIETIVKAALDSSVDETLVVLGADRGEVKRTLRSYPVRFAVNADYRKGMLSTIQAGFQAMPWKVEAAVIMLGDQPAIPVQVVDDIIGAFRETRKGMVVPVHGGRRGHPILVGAKYKEEILGLDPEVGLRQLVRAHADDIFEVEAATPAIHMDLDLPADYEAALSGPDGKPREG